MGKYNYRLLELFRQDLAEVLLLLPSGDGSPPLAEGRETSAEYCSAQ